MFTPFYPTCGKFTPPNSTFDKLRFPRNTPQRLTGMGESATIKAQKRNRILWLGQLLFCVVYVSYQDGRSEDFRNHQNDCLDFVLNRV